MANSHRRRTAVINGPPWQPGKRLLITYPFRRSLMKSPRWSVIDICRRRRPPRLTDGISPSAVGRRAQQTQTRSRLTKLQACWAKSSLQRPSGEGRGQLRLGEGRDCPRQPGGSPQATPADAVQSVPLQLTQVILWNPARARVGRCIPSPVGDISSTQPDWQTAIIGLMVCSACTQIRCPACDSGAGRRSAFGVQRPAIHRRNGSKKHRARFGGPALRAADQQVGNPPVVNKLALPQPAFARPFQARSLANPHQCATRRSPAVNATALNSRC